MGVLPFVLQLSEAARGVREQKQQAERQKPFPKFSSIFLKLKQRFVWVIFLFLHYISNNM